MHGRRTVLVRRAFLVVSQGKWRNGDIKIAHVFVVCMARRQFRPYLVFVVVEGNDERG